MKILFYLYQYPAIGGIEAVTAVLAGEFLKVGHKVVILSHIEKRQNFDVLGGASDVPLYKMPDSSFYSRRNRDYLQRLIQEHSIDLVIFQDCYAPIEMNLFSGELNAKVILCEHNAPYANQCWNKYKLPFPISLMWEWRRRWIAQRVRRYEERRRQFLYAKCWRYVLLSDRYFGEFRAVTKLADLRKLRSIGNPLTIKTQGAVQKRNEIVFVGTVEYRKGSDLLPIIIKSVLTQHSDWNAKIIGDGPGMADLRNQLAGVSGVEMLGYQSDSSMFFSEAKVFVFPTRREGWGLVIPEAQFCGCVPVTFDSFSAARDLIKDGEDGFVVPAFDLSVMCEKLKCLMEDDQLFSRMSSAAQRSAARHEVKNVINKWQALFDEMV